MEHGSIITQARREDALVLTKQGRGQQLPKTLRRPRSGRGLTPPRNRGLAPDLPRLRTGDSTRDPRSFRPGVRVRTPTPVGVARAPRGRGVICAAVTPSRASSPGRDRGAAPAARVPRVRLLRVGGGSSLSRTTLHAALGPRAGGEGRGSRAGTEPGVSHFPGPPAPRATSGGTWDQVHSAGAGAGAEPGGPARGRDLRGAGSRAAASRRGRGANRPSPSPRGAPGRPCTQSRVCSARERCPWLHNSPDGIRPGVVLSRAAKKCGLSVGSGPASPRAGWGCEEAGGRPCRGAGGRWGPEGGSLEFGRGGGPGTLAPSPLLQASRSAEDGV